MTQEFNHFPEILAKFRTAIDSGLFEGAEIIASEVKLSMRAAKHGITRKSSRTGKAHTASAPGESPAIDTSALVNSITNKKEGPNARSISTNQEYAAFLEFGTPGGKIAARPFLRPAAENTKDKVQEHMNKKLNEALS